MRANTSRTTRSRWATDAGTTASEYATLLALVIIVVLVSWMLLGQNTSGAVSTASTAFHDAGGAGGDAGAGTGGDDGDQGGGKGRGRGHGGGTGHGKGGG